MDKQNLSFSLIIPVYNRPGEVEELLESLTLQTEKGFEVIIVEDGSTNKSDEVVGRYKNQLDVKYFFKPNSGPGQSRNYGYERASGNYCIFLDSDCVIPPDYFKIVKSSLSENYVDAFGGPDKAHENFTDLQKAINYSMTSFLTTGGIRGGSEKLDKFYPRSFNMGYSREVYEKTQGFAKMRFGEDIDMSTRILELGFKTRLIKEAFVFHKRRSTLRQFYKQVYNSGIARINLYKRHPSSLKLVHFAPALFVLFTLLMITLSIFVSWTFVLPSLVHMGLLFADSTLQNNLRIGAMSIVTSYTQLFGYGFGFLVSFWKRLVLGKDEFSAFNKNFYK